MLFPISFVLGTSTPQNNIEVHSEHYYPLDSRPALLDLKEPFTLKVLAQRPISLVLIMINSCSYSTNDLVFKWSQIFDQDLSRCLASTKN